MKTRTIKFPYKFSSNNKNMVTLTISSRITSTMTNSQIITTTIIKDTSSKINNIIIRIRIISNNKSNLTSIQTIKIITISKIRTNTSIDF